VSDRRKDSARSPQLMGRLSDMADPDKLKDLLNSMPPLERKSVEKTLRDGRALSQLSPPLPRGLLRKLLRHLDVPPHGRLTKRELRVWDVIQRGVKGREYCRELGNAGIAPLRSGAWEGCPRKYESAYLEGNPWRHMIQSEKAKIRRKAELAGLAELAN
jgi:hypothetical protein